MCSGERRSHSMKRNRASPSHIAGAEFDEPLRRLGNNRRMSLSVRVFDSHRSFDVLRGPQISAVLDCPGQIFFGGLTRYAQLIADFLDRIACDPV